MRNTSSEAPKPLLPALFTSLCGMGSFMVSFSWLPLYTRSQELSDGAPVTGWEFAERQVEILRLEGVNIGSLIGIALGFLPVAIMLVAGLINIIRVVFGSNLLSVPFRSLYAVGASSLGIMVGLLLIHGNVNFGALGEITGYALLFLADYLFRRARAATP